MGAQSLPVRAGADLCFYFRRALDVALQRIVGGRNAIKYYDEAGMDWA